MRNYQIHLHHVLIMGDFNHPEIIYVTETVTAGTDDPATVFFDKTQELCLFQHVTETLKSYELDNIKHPLHSIMCLLIKKPNRCHYTQGTFCKE